MGFQKLKLRKKKSTLKQKLPKKITCIFEIIPTTNILDRETIKLGPVKILVKEDPGTVKYSDEDSDNVDAKLSHYSAMAATLFGKSKYLKYN
jgi:hypothetical protein